MMATGNDVSGRLPAWLYAPARAPSMLVPPWEERLLMALFRRPVSVVKSCAVRAVSEKAMTAIGMSVGLLAASHRAPDFAVLSCPLMEPDLSITAMT